MEESFELYGQDIYQYCNGRGCTTRVNTDYGIYCDEYDDITGYCENADLRGKQIKRAI
tara:strand:- start:1644 stop:1817 length:174 start_codon:yes stop_codon:yes gene_type:complete